MFGLIEKDLRLTLVRKQTLFIFLAMALIMGQSMEGEFLVGYLTMFAVLVAIGTTSYDEFDNGFAFLMTLPFDRKTYVREKYLFCLMMAAAAWCFGIVLYVIGTGIRHSAISLTGQLPMLLGIIPTVLISACVMIPLQLKFGMEKSRMILFALFGFIVVMTAAWKKVMGNGPALPDALPPAAVLLSLMAAFLLLALASYRWSVRIMEKKEL